MDMNEVQAVIKAVIPDAEITVDGEGCNFSVTVVSASFEGQSPVQRQRAVMAPFKDKILSGELHALSIKALTPKES
jgi:acid stress-induced BolA-like protein IbaG/YrbA